jgi:hypothetical protein
MVTPASADMAEGARVIRLAVGPEAGAPKDEVTAVAVQRMLDDGAPTWLPRRVRRSRWVPLELKNEPSAEERAAQRRAARRLFRVYCFACGRSSEVSVAPVRPGRCLQCGGTMLVDVAAD